MTSKYDEELVQFFTGFDYRYDILHKIDEEVKALQYRLYHGERVEYAQKKLVVLTLYGNLVDAFKVNIFLSEGCGNG